MGHIWFQSFLCLLHHFLLILLGLVSFLSCLWSSCLLVFCLLAACTSEGVGYTFRSSRDGIFFGVFEVGFSSCSGNRLSSFSVTPSFISQSIDAVLLFVRESWTSPHVISGFLSLIYGLLQGVLNKNSKYCWSSSGVFILF